MTDRPPPLNGTKTHPLKEASIAALRELLNGPIVRYAINPGVINRLRREGLIEESVSPSRGSVFYRITEAGRKRLWEIDHD